MTKPGRKRESVPGTGKKTKASRHAKASKRKSRTKSPTRGGRVRGY